MQKYLIFGAVFLVIAITIALFGLFLAIGSVTSRVNAQEPSEATPSIQSVATNEPITINKVLTSPVVYKDLGITVEGRIVGWTTKKAFVVSEVGEKDSKKKLLIIRDQNFGLPNEIPATDVALGESVNVSIGGRAGILRISEGDKSWGDEDEVRELMKWNNKPVIFATSVVQK